MNPKTLLKALDYMREGLTPAVTAAKAASRVTPKKVAGPDVLTMRNIKVDPNTAAAIRAVSGSNVTVPNPEMVSYGQFPVNPQAVRQAALDEKAAMLAMQNAEYLNPMFRKTRNVGLGTGLGIGAIPPSLYALWLMSQQDNQDQ